MCVAWHLGTSSACLHNFKSIPKSRSGELQYYDFSKILDRPLRRLITTAKVSRVKAADHQAYYCLLSWRLSCPPLSPRNSLRGLRQEGLDTRRVVPLRGHSNSALAFMMPASTTTSVWSLTKPASGKREISEDHGAGARAERMNRRAREWRERMLGAAIQSFYKRRYQRSHGGTKLDYG